MGCALSNQAVIRPGDNLRKRRDSDSSESSSDDLPSNHPDNLKDNPDIVKKKSRLFLDKRTALEAAEK